MNGVQRSWRSVIGLFRYHLLFFLPVRLDELRPGTPRARKLHAALTAWRASIATLDDAQLELTIGAVKDDLSVMRSSISEMRSRAAQLLAVTGFVTVLATLGASLPSTAIARTATFVVAGVALYALVGTLWLTVQALAVRSWSELRVKPSRGPSFRADREQYAYDVYRVYRYLRAMRDRPVGYLRDAYWFFFATVALIVALVAIRLVAQP